MTNEIHCRVFEGLCNRINCLASALATGRPVYLRWAVNRHCPLRFEDLFEPIEGVTARSEPVDDYPYAASARRICWFYPKNVDKLPQPMFRERLYAAYRRIIGHMTVRPDPLPERPVMGVAYRHLLPGGDTFEHFWDCISDILPRITAGPVMVACDHAESKERLVYGLADLNVAAFYNDCWLLTNDLDRTEESVLGMGLDLVALSYCTGGILASSSRSTVADSARGFGIRVYYAHRSPDFRFHGDDDAFEFHGADELLLDHHFGTTKTQPLLIPAASRL